MSRIFVLFLAPLLAAKLEANSSKVYIHTVSSIILRSNIIGRLRKKKLGGNYLSSKETKI